MKSLIVIASSLVAMMTASWANAESWRVESKIEDGDRIVVEPVFIMTTDEPASLELDGANGFRYAVALEHYGDSLLLMTHFREGAVELNPELVARPGESVSIDVDDYTFTVRVTAVAK